MKNMLPDLYAEDPDFYRNMRIQDLAQGIHLFSIGIDKTRAMGLLRGLTEFKRAYDLNLRVKNMLPDLYAEDPDFYRNMRIQDLAQGIH
ncbi:hypothetical protein CKQ90_31730, partial [Klebsiella pneumoniae]